MTEFDELRGKLEAAVRNEIGADGQPVLTDEAKKRLVAVATDVITKHLASRIEVTHTAAGGVDIFVPAAFFPAPTLREFSIPLPADLAEKLIDPESDDEFRGRVLARARTAGDVNLIPSIQVAAGAELDALAARYDDLMRWPGAARAQPAQPS